MTIFRRVLLPLLFLGVFGCEDEHGEADFKEFGYGNCTVVYREAFTTADHNEERRILWLVCLAGAVAEITYLPVEDRIEVLFSDGSRFSVKPVEGGAIFAASGNEPENLGVADPTMLVERFEESRSDATGEIFLKAEDLIGFIMK